MGYRESGLEAEECGGAEEEAEEKKKEDGVVGVVFCQSFLS